MKPTSNSNNKTIITLMDYIGQVVDQTAREILKYTPQLYTKKPDETENILPEATASGVLLKVKNVHFLITAGHVLEDHKPEDIGIMIGDTFNILNGHIKYVRPSESTVADKIDIAVWQLDMDVAEDIGKRYSFLPLEKIDYEHDIDKEPKYLIVGFPWRKSKVNKKTKKIKVSPLIFLTNEAKEKFYNQLKFEKHSNLLLNYRQMKVKNFDTRYVQSNTNPQGISGCGVWHIPKFFIPDFKLVGQVIEQNNDKTILITTRIHLVTEVLRQEFGLDIHQSTKTKLNTKAT